MTLEELERRFVEWAGGRPDVRAAVVVGSRARSERPPDEWSDLDIAVFVRDDEALLAGDGWVRRFGRAQITFIEQVAQEVGRERRVFYEGGIDADFTVLPVAQLRVLAAYYRLPAWLRARLPAVVRSQLERRAAVFGAIAGRGFRILLDKDGLATELLARLPPPPGMRLPSAAELEEVASDFWYHAIWAEKKLRRGEVFTAKGCVDSYMKRLLLRVLEWHAQATRAADTWHEGRFLEEWADERAIAGLRAAYAHYDAEDVARALAATMDLFAWLARETAERLGLAYNAAAETVAYGFVTEKR